MVSRDNRREPTAVSKATSSPGGTKHAAKRAKRCRNREPLRWLCKLVAVQLRGQTAVRAASGGRTQQGEFSQGWPRQRSLAHTRTSSSVEYSPALLQEGCGLLAYHDTRRHRVAGRHTWHYRSIRNTKTVHTVDLQFSVYHRHR